MRTNEEAGQRITDEMWPLPIRRTAPRVLLLLGLLGVLVAPCVRAASFDCAKAISPMERAICSDTKLSTADGEMAAAYRRTLELLPPESAATLRADQRRWLEALQRGCQVADVEELPKGGKPVDAPSGSPEAQANLKRIAACMMEPYANHTEVLKHSYARIDGTVFLTRSLLLLSPDLSPDGDAPAGAVLFPGFGSLQVSWPEAQSTDPHWMAWNTALRERLQRAASVNGKAVKPGWRESMAEGADTTLTARTPAVNQGRVSVAVEEDGMGHGAAHPNESFFTYTWLLDTGRPLTPQDIFQPGSAWKRTLALYAWKDLTTGEKRDMLYDRAHGAANKALLEDIGNAENWTITRRGLNLSWPEYTVAPRAAGLDDTVVPWSAVRGMLLPGFVP